MDPANDIVSVVAPIRNASTYIESFVRDTVRVLAAKYASFELILVDDGSTDDTVDRVIDLLGDLPGIRLICLSRQTGDDIAMTAGLEHVVGDVIVTLNPAIDPPELIPELVGKVRDPIRIVVGVRDSRRGESLRARLGAFLFYRLSSRLLGVRLPSDATQFRAIDRRALNALLRIKDRLRHLRFLTLQTGYRFETFSYHPVLRAAAPLDRSLLSAISLAVDSSVAIGRRPLRLVSILGLIGSLLNVLYAGYVIAIFVLKNQVAEGWTTLSLELSVMFFLLFALLAVLSEYIGHILLEIKDRPLYNIAEEHASLETIPNARAMNVVDSVPLGSGRSAP